MAKSFYDVYGCSLCEREIMTETGEKKEYVCCDLPMRMVRENTEFEKVDSTEWPAEKLSVNLEEEIGYSEKDFVAKSLIATPNTEVRALTFKAGQETVYEKAGHDMSLFVVEGTGIMALGYQDLELVKSTTVVIPKGMLWGIKNTGGSPMVVLQTINKR